MGRFGPQIAYYLETLRRGDADGAFHGLLEIGRDVLPELMAVYRSEGDVGARELLVEVIWQYRVLSVIPFLGEALCDSEPRVWRQALDGLVSLGSPTSLEILRMAHTQQFPTTVQTEEFRRWLVEAIEQAET